SVSIADISKTAAVPVQSLYNTFGDKKELYKRAMTHYGKMANDPIIQSLESIENPLQALTEFARAWKRHINADADGGCFFTQALATANSAIDQCDASIPLAFTKRLRKVLIARAREAADQGSLESDPDATADALLTLAFGVAVMGRGGLPAVAIRRAVDTAMRLLGASENENEP
ncbi:MAG: TetR/AcrR family transcriptional regulator, partial [Planctomycetota bacterium]